MIQSVFFIKLNDKMIDRTDDLLDMMWFGFNSKIVRDDSVKQKCLISLNR